MFPGTTKGVTETVHDREQGVLAGFSAIVAFPLRIKRKNTPLLLSVKRRTTAVITSRDNSKGDGRSLHYGLSTPPSASQAFVPGVARETRYHLQCQPMSAE
jgi:hypothetical protein